MTVTKKNRFEVFKRDSFTCQYCGRAAPDVILEVDHIHPKKEGGDDRILNLVTACRDCNSGKRARLLSDDTVIKKQKQQLDELQERREQLEMMLEWQRSLADLDEVTVHALASFWDDLVPEYHLNETGLQALRKYIRRFSVPEILEAMRISADEYLQWDYSDPSIVKPTHNSVDKAWNYVPRVCNSRRMQEEKPYLRDLYYTRGILKNRFSLGKRKYHSCISMMEDAILLGVSTDKLKQGAKRLDTWEEFVALIINLINDATKETGDGQEAV